jgi:low temperature requirement protein LtrA
VAVQTALDSGAASGRLIGVALGGLLIVFSMWWLYFSQRTSDVTHRVRARFEEAKQASSFIWGYGHFFVFAAAAAVGAGLATVVDADLSEAVLSERGAVTAVAVPVAIFVVVVWRLHRDTDRVTTAQDRAHPVAAAAVVVLAIGGLPVWTLGLVLVALVAFTTVGRTAPTGRAPTG